MLLSGRLACSLLVLFLSFKSFNAETANPGVKFRLTDKGINYALAIGEKSVNEKLNRSKLPGIRVQIDAGPGKGQMEIRKLSMEGFQAPRYRYQLLPPSGIKWTATEGSLTLKGAWSAWYKYLFKVSVNGYFIATANNFTLSAVLDLSKDSDGRLQFKVPYCKSAVQSMKVKITGGAVPKAINIFRSAIEDALEEAIKRQVCKQVQTVLVQRANKKIHHLPTRIKVFKQFFLDYTLTTDPAIHDQMIDAAINGSITFNGEPSEVTAPQMPESMATDRMMYLWISDYVAQTLFTSVHKHGLLKGELNRNNTPTFTKGLRTTCPNSMCVGTLSDQLSEQHPDTFVLLDVWTDSPPTFTFSTSQSELNAQAWCKMYVEPKSDENLVLVFQVDFKAHLTPYFKQNRLCGNATVKNLEMNVTKSNIGEISSLEIFLLLGVVQPRLETRLNEILGAGVPIPVYDNVELVEPKITVLHRAIQVEADYQYVEKKDVAAEDAL